MNSCTGSSIATACAPIRPSPELRRLFPDAPSGPSQGARDQYSTYLHLLVCMLEYDGVRRLFGDDVARRTVQGWRHYAWIYRQVLDQPQKIRRVLAAHRLDDPDARRK
jgi:hypothetical protein